MRRWQVLLIKEAKKQKKKSVMTVSVPDNLTGEFEIDKK